MNNLRIFEELALIKAETNVNEIIIDKNTFLTSFNPIWVQKMYLWLCLYNINLNTKLQNETDFLNNISVFI